MDNQVSLISLSIGRFPRRYAPEEIEHIKPVGTCNSLALSSDFMHGEWEAAIKDKSTPYHSKTSWMLDSDILFDQAAKHAYQLQWKLAQGVMKQGHGVIVDNTCNFPELLDQESAWVKQHGYAYWHIQCNAQDVGLLDRWLRIRGPITSQRTDCHPAVALVEAKTLALP
jgi:predicted kinase